MAKVIVEISDEYINLCEGSIVDIVKDALEFCEIPSSIKEAL